MAKIQETINGLGGNLKPMFDVMQEARRLILIERKKRDECNAVINEQRAKVKALGISKSAFDTALNRSEMDPEKREQLDTDYSLACEALNVPLKQADLDFTGKPQPKPQLAKDDNNATSKKQASNA